MAKRNLPFQRGGARFRAQPKVLVICEDSKSSKNYLDDVKIQRHNAARALQEAREVNDFNPSTCIHELIAWIERLGGPIPIESSGGSRSEAD